jgi:hypothetical protein
MTQMNAATTAAPSEKPASRFTSGPALVLYIAAGKLLLHLLTAARYGIFRDEMYYLACSQHMAWGYVDQPPLTVAIGWIARHVFGESALAIRLLPALAGAAVVWLTGKLAREMGGGRFAQALAAFAVVVVPIYLVLHHWLTDKRFRTPDLDCLHLVGDSSHQQRRRPLLALVRRAGRRRL